MKKLENNDKINIIKNDNLSFESFENETANEQKLVDNKKK